MIIMDLSATSQVVSTKYLITVRCLVNEHVVTSGIEDDRYRISPI